MTKLEFQKYISQNSPVILDGATGSNLQKKGMPFGVCVEKWVTENENVLIELQKEYIEAGSKIIYASTFGANSIKLREYGLENEAEELNKKLIAISKKAADGKALVAADITMCGQTLEPLGDLKLEDLIASYEQQIKAADEAGADLIVIETMMSLQETRAAVIAAKNVSTLPIIVSMTFSEGGKTLYGTDAKTAAIVMDSLGVDAVGMNCSAGPDKMISLVEEMKSVTKLPIIAKPNAGLPVLGKDGETVYDMDAETFAKYMKDILRAGAQLVGGCCGTNPEYIEKIKSITSDFVIKEGTKADCITSERTSISIDEVEYCLIDIDENADIRDEFESDEYDTIYDILDEMEDEEQNVIRLKMNFEDANIQDAQKILTEITNYSSAPICFETESEEILENVLMRYCGCAGVICTRAEEVSGIIEKYGAISISKQ